MVNKRKILKKEKLIILVFLFLLIIISVLILLFSKTDANNLKTENIIMFENNQSQINKESQKKERLQNAIKSRIDLTDEIENSTIDIVYDINDSPKVFVSITLFSGKELSAEQQISIKEFIKSCISNLDESNINIAIND